MSFRDYHDGVAKSLSLEPIEAREQRTFLLRCYKRGLSMNAAAALIRHGMAPKKKDDDEQQGRTP